MNRWKIYGVSGLVILFFLSFYFFTGDSKGKKQYELEGVKSVDSLKEVDQFFYDKTPGLKRAEEKGLVTELDQTIPLDYPDGSLHLDKMWHTPHGSYLYYSRDISSIGKDEDGPGTPGIVNVSFRQLEKIKSYRRLSSYSEGMRFSEGVQFNGRYYHRVKLDPLKRRDVKEPLKPKLFPMTITLEVDGVESYINDVELPIGFDKSKEEYQSFDINRTIDLAPLDAKLHFNQIKIGYYSTKLYYDVDMNSPEKIKRVGLRIMNDEESIGGGHSTERSFSDTKANFIQTSDPISKFPNEISILVSRVVMKSDKNITFSIDTSDITDESTFTEENIHKKLDHFLNTDIFYESYRFEPEDEFFVTVKYVTPQLEKPFVQLMNEIPRPIFDKENKRPTMYVEAYNQEGDNVIGGGGFGGPKGLEREFGFELEKDFVEESDKIDISINHLPYELVLDEKFSVPIEK